MSFKGGRMPILKDSNRAHSAHTITMLQLALNPIERNEIEKFSFVYANKRIRHVHRAHYGVCSHGLWVHTLEFSVDDTWHVPTATNDNGSVLNLLIFHVSLILIYRVQWWRVCTCAYSSNVYHEVTFIYMDYWWDCSLLRCVHDDQNKLWQTES